MLITTLAQQLHIKFDNQN